jgi:hypothetical protein
MTIDSKVKQIAANINDTNNTESFSAMNTLNDSMSQSSQEGLFYSSNGNEIRYGGNANDDKEEDYVLDLEYLNQQANTNTTAGYDSSSYVQNINIDYTRGIWGAPYQFLPLTDMRISGNCSDDDLSGFGIEFGERIVARLPLLLMTPGKPKFMPDFDDKSKASLLSQLSVNGISDELKNILNNQLGKTGGKYYDLKFAYSEYYQYVNTEANTMATLLGISNIPMSAYGVDGGNIGTYNWANYTNAALTGAYNSKEFVAFYVEADNVSDSFSNSTSQSMLASAANQVSDVGREIGFLLGTEGSFIDSLSINAEDMNSILTSTQDKLGGLSSKIPIVGNLIQDIGSKLTTVMTGAKLLFPEIWEDSSFTRSYSINMKLRTPDADVLSWYINIGVPLCHLISFVLPMQTSGDTNQGYRSPFLIRGFYKGSFNCDMGIITDMQITKGGDSQWTLSGLPLEVDVSFTIKELYSAMSMTNNDGSGMTTIMDNESLLNYLMNTCAINIAEPSLQRKLNLYENAYINKITNIPGNIKNSFDEGVSQLISDLLS